MNLTSKIIKYINVKKYSWFRMLSQLGFFDSMDDEKYLKKLYKIKLGKELNLDDPKTFCEKVQWLKLYDRNPDYIKMVDKYEVKKYVSDIIGNDYIIPTYGVWNSFDEIDFDVLPNQFILKCTHDSGGFVICKDKKTFNYDEARKKLSKYLKINYYFMGREWVYKDIKPRIIAEKYIDTLGKPDSVEYKLTCFDGRVGLITICRGIAHSSFDVRTNDNYDRDFNYLPFYAFYKNTKPTKRPEQLDEIIEICEKLSSNIPQVRVDCYIIDGKVYFGEMTFYTWSGFIEFTPDEWDRKLGDMIKLPQKHIY